MGLCEIYHGIYSGNVGMYKVYSVMFSSGAEGREWEGSRWVGGGISMEKWK